MQNRKFTDSLVRHSIATPFLWAMFVPIAFADICIEIYHHVCFPLYRKPLVKRSEYIRLIDRAKLPYLTWPERLGCAYCGYVNGWLHYASALAGESEKYWCAIAHLEERGYKPAEHEKTFLPYGDEKAYNEKFPKSR